MGNWDKLVEIRLREAQFKEAKKQVEKANTVESYVSAVAKLSLSKIKLEAANHRLKSSYTANRKSYTVDNFGGFL